MQRYTVRDWMYTTKKLTWVHPWLAVCYVSSVHISQEVYSSCVVVWGKDTTVKLIIHCFQLPLNNTVLHYTLLCINYWYWTCCKFFMVVFEMSIFLILQAFVKIWFHQHRDLFLLHAKWETNPQRHSSVTATQNVEWWGISIDSTQRCR